MKGSVLIPKSELADLVAQTSSAQRRATELLRQLEEAYLGEPVQKVGSWRQDTSRWIQPNS